MRNEALFLDVMTAPPRPAGEAVPDWSARRAPSIVPKLLVAGVALVAASAIFSPVIDRHFEQRRVAAQLEEKREKARAELERRAVDVEMRLLGERQKAWESLSSLGVKAPPEGLGLPLPVPLKLDTAITADAEDYATRGQAKAVDAAIREYKAGTQQVLEYVARTRAEQRREAGAQPKAATHVAPAIDLPRPAAPAARLSSAPPPPVFAPPKPVVRTPPPAPAYIEKRQVTNW